MSKKAATAAKQSGKSATVTPKRAKAEELQLAQNIEVLSGLETAAPAAAPQAQDQAQSAVELLARPAQQESAVRENSAREVDAIAHDEAILTAVQDSDHGGASLLIEAAATKGAKDEDDDKAAAWQWSDALPWLAALGGIAALASIRTSSGTAPAGAGASGASGVVFDTPVTNAIVFRDANGNGKWDAGESITTTNSQGSFSGLGGTGNIVATSLDRLVARINNVDHTYAASDYAAFNAVSGLHLTSGVAVDVGADFELGTGDDFVWSGTYSAAATQTQGSLGVYVTAVSTLVTAYLAAQGITAPTQAQINTAVAQLSDIFSYDHDSGVTGQGGNVQFFTSDLNGQVTKIMGEAIAKAQAAGTDVQQAINDALNTLGQAAADAHTAETVLDLASAADLASIYGLTTVEAEALALQTASAGPAVYSIWYTEDGHAMATAIDSVDTIQNDGPIGNITVLTQSEGSSAELVVEPTDDADTLSLQHAHVLVQAAGDGSAADLTLSSATGTLTEVVVRADGNVGSAVGDATWRTYITDGGDDQYDDGNYISSDTTTEIAYSGTVASGNFGVGSENVAVYQDSIFGMLVKGNTSDTFTVTGETGSDGSGSEDTLTLAEYNGYQAIVIRTYGDDPSINRVFIYKADAGVSAAVLDEDTDTEDFFISGLSAVDDFGYFVVYGDSNSDPIAEADLESFFHTAVDNVMSAGSIEEMKTAFYDSDTQTALRGSMSLYAEFTNYEYSIDGAFTLSSSDVAVSTDATANADIDFSGDVQGSLSVVAAGDSADATLSLHSTSGAVNLQGGDINVTASGVSSDASATINDVSGTVGVVSVTASGYSGDAHLNLNVNEDAQLEVASLSVTASGVLAAASANVSGDLLVTGGVSVVASGESADAHLTLTDIGSTDTFSGGDVSVTASGVSSDASATINDVSGTVGALTTTASGYGSTASVTINNNGDRELVLQGVPAHAISVVPGSVFFQSDAVGAEQGLAYTGFIGNSGEADIFSVDGADPTFSGTSANVDYTWGSGDVLNSGASEEVQVHWTGFIRWPGEDGVSTPVNFYNRSDDGFILKLNGNSVISDWEEQGDRTYNGSGSYEAVAGELVQVDIWYYENGGGAVAQLYWDQLAPPESVSVSVTASGADATATTSISADVRVEGPIEVTASGVSADAHLTLTDIGCADTDTFTGGELRITASGTSSDAGATLNNVNGILGAISVTASGYSGDAHLDLNAKEMGLLQVASLTVEATNTSADANADIAGPVEIFGDLTVTASAGGAIANADINTSGFFTDLGVDGGYNNVTVLADVADAQATLSIGNAQGSISSLNVTANDGTASLDIGVANYSTLTINTVDVTGNGTGHASADLHGDIGSTLAITGDITVSANGALDPADLYVNGTTDGATVLGSGSGPAINDIQVTASNGASAYAYLNNASGRADELQVTAESGDADAELDIAVNADAALTVARLGVTAHGANDDAQAYLWTRGESSELTVTGNIEVSARSSDAYAYAELNRYEWTMSADGYWSGVDATGHLVLGGGDILVEATGASADASADIRNASGTVGAIEVTASGDDAIAALTLRTESHNSVDGVTADSLTVTASGESADASADILGDVAITGAISVTASGNSADASANINTSGSGHTVLGVAGEAEVIEISYDVANATVGGHLITTITTTADVQPGTAAVGADLTIQASGTSADASADIRNASGTVADIRVAASGYSGDATLYLETESHNSVDGVTAASLTVEASGTGSRASADISGDVTITGAISVTSSGESADATADINTSGSGRTVLGVAATPAVTVETTVLLDGHVMGTYTEVVREGSAAVGSDLTVTASGASADASADLRNVSGIVADIRVTASGVSSDAYLNLAVEDGEWLQAASLTVQADVYADESSNDAAAVIYGNISIAGDITVTGGDEASVDINTNGAGHTLLGGGAITVAADGDDSDANADIRNASGTVGDISVTAGDLGESADAFLNLATESYDGVDGVTAASLTVEARGVDTEASAVINGAVAFTGDLRVQASGDHAAASADINHGGNANEFQAFFLPALFGFNGWSYVSGDVLSVEVDGHTLTYTIGSMDSPGDWAQSLNVQADNLGLAVDFGVCGDLELDAQWHDGSNHALLQFSHNSNAGVVPDDWYYEMDGSDAAGSTVLGANGEASDITVSASGNSADAVAHIYNASGTAGTVEVLAGGYDAYAYLDLRVANGEQLESGNIIVSATDFSGDAEIDINGNLVVSGNIVVTAAGDSSYVDAEINNAGFDSSEDVVYAGETRLQGGDISVTAGGDSAEALAWVHNASGTLRDLTVVATGESADATLDLKAQATGQHQMQIITLTDAELSALGERDSLGVWIDGTYFEAHLSQAFYTSNADKLAEFVQGIRDSGAYADLGADVYQDGNSLVIRWHDYENHAYPRSIDINGTDARGFSQSVNAVAPSLAFGGSSDVTVAAVSNDAQAHAAVDAATGSLGHIAVIAGGFSSADTTDAQASLALGFTGDLSGDVFVLADGVYNSATLDLHADPSGRINLAGYGCQDVVVAAIGLGAQASASLSGLSGTLDHLDVYADVKDAEASANLQFVDGSLRSVSMDAVDHQSTVRMTVDQTERSGSVAVGGEGHAAMSFYVDRSSATAQAVDLRMHYGDNASSHDWWGYADIDLVAKYNDVLHQPGSGLQTSCNDTLWNNRMDVAGFNVERDSINAIVQDDADGDEGTQNHLVRHEIAFTHAGDTTVNEADFGAALQDLLSDARWYFDHYTGDADQGYYYREITVDPAYGPNYVRSFAVYDFNLGSEDAGTGLSGASGLIDLGYTTGLSERNVADRYDIVTQTEGYIDETGPAGHMFNGVHAIDSLTVRAYDGGENYQDYYARSADVMVSDITVEARNSGYHGYDDTSYASLALGSYASNGCGDSYLELRQSDVNVLASTSNEYGSADAYLSLRDAWGTLNSITVEANQSADATAELAYLSYWSDYDSLGSVKVHDVDVRAMNYDANAYLRTMSSDLTFDHSVVNVTAGYDARGDSAYAYGSHAGLDVNWDNRCGDVDGVISELNVRVDGAYSSAWTEFNRYAGDIDLLRVTADGWYSSADADVEFDNSYDVINALHEIYVRADGERTDARAYVHANYYSHDIQFTGGDIYVGAVGYYTEASLDMNEVPVSGQANQIVVEAWDHSSANAWISGHDLSVTHERGMSGDIWNDSSIRVSAGDHSSVGLDISGYGQYLDSVVLAAGESSDATLSLGMTGFIDTLDIQVADDNSYVSADITQLTYGGVVNVSASGNYYSTDIADEVIHENNVVDLAYHTATAQAINIDNSNRDFERGHYSGFGGWHFVSGDVDDTLQLNLLLDVADEDIPYTSQATLLAYRVQIDGWTDNDTISFNGQSGDAGSNYAENWNDVSIASLFSSANSALDGTVDYYFGVSGGNGYLFHDEDGVGITTVVELLGVTAFDDHQIRGTNVI